MEKGRMSLGVREVQIKAIMRYYLLPVSILVIKRVKDKCQQGYGEIETLRQCWWECKMVPVL